jgi:hypothetical protein
MTVRALASLPFLVAAVGSQSPEITSPSVVRTRAVWFVQSENPIGAEVGFAHSAAAWDDATEKACADAKPGTRLALGGDVWAALETFTDLQFGAVAVKAGNYYAVLEKGKDGWVLGLLAPDKVRAAQLAPGNTKGQTLVAAIPLTAQQRTSGALQAAWETGASSDTITLVLGFGPHQWRAAAKVKGAGDGQPLVFPDQRGASRVTGAASAAKTSFAVVDHGVVPWKDDVAQDAKSMAVGKRWRLGKDWATTLDTNTAMVLGGKKLAAGAYHLTLGKAKDGWNLVVSAAEVDHRAKLDGFAADYVQPVIEVPLQASVASPTAASLQIAFVNDGGKLRLVITFGGEQLAVPVLFGGSGKS